jgi:dipeptidyl aminopeptidase/acylaminoacyl peptidase
VPRYEKTIKESILQCVAENPAFLPLNNEPKYKNFVEKIKGNLGMNIMADEKIVLGTERKYPLNGILTIPDETKGLFPAVVLVHGSGPSNMDEKFGNISPFKDLAEGLSGKGIAVLRYDKRTFVYGKEMINDTSLSVKEETIEDAILAADFFRKDSRIDSTKIFIIGHSFRRDVSPTN